MIEGEVFQLLGNFGFPIAIAIYLLMRFEGKIDSLRNSIELLSNDIAKSIDEINKK
jgi:hypothetical protein